MNDYNIIQPRIIAIAYTASNLAPYATVVVVPNAMFTAVDRSNYNHGCRQRVVNSMYTRSSPMDTWHSTLPGPEPALCRKLSKRFLAL